MMKSKNIIALIATLILTLSFSVIVLANDVTYEIEQESITIPFTIEIPTAYGDTDGMKITRDYFYGDAGTLEINYVGDGQVYYSINTNSPSIIFSGSFTFTDLNTNATRNVSVIGTSGFAQSPFSNTRVKAQLSGFCVYLGGIAAPSPNAYITFSYYK